MRTNWVARPLADLTETGSPITYGVVKPGDEDSDGVLLVRSGDIADGRVLTQQLRTITKVVSAQYRRTLLRGGELLVSLVGNPGQVAIAPPSLADANIARQVALVRLDRSVDARFVKYYFLSREGQSALGAQSIGSVQKVINLRDLQTVPIPLPPVAEQRAIADVLGALDDKIELNQRMSATLEEMARALFRSWFVDFDPVRAKAEGRPSGLPPDLDALFPASFEASELGEIPAGWEVRSLDEIATFTNGLALQRFPPEGDEWLPVIKIAEMKRGYTEKTGKASASIDSRRIVEDGDVLFSWSGSLEMVLWTHGRGALNQHLFKVTSDEFPRWFYLGWTREHLDEFRGIAAGKATTMGHIQRHHLTDAKVVVPPPGVVAAGDATLALLVEQQVRHATGARALATQRDTLLPRMLSGELSGQTST